MTELQQRIFDAATAALTELVDLDRPFFNPVRLLAVGGSSSEMAGGTIGHQSDLRTGRGTGRGRADAGRKPAASNAPSSAASI